MIELLAVRGSIVAASVTERASVRRRAIVARTAAVTLACSGSERKRASTLRSAISIADADAGAASATGKAAAAEVDEDDEAKRGSGAAKTRAVGDAVARRDIKLSAKRARNTSEERASESRAQSERR